jgi:hypothetical protein
MLRILPLLLLSAALVACGGGESGEEQQSADTGGAPELELVVESTGPAAVDGAELQRARGAVNKLGMALKKELGAAMQQGGPEAALHVCNTRAAEVTEALCSEEGLDVARVSTRWRNPDNAPDELEAAVLARFQADPALADTLVGLPDGGILYMKPIRVQSPMCLNCHGDEDALAAGVPERLAALYPDDRATGFSEGDLRGAFTVRFPASER